MKIGIDGRALQGRRTGVGRYAYELCRELDKALPSAQFFVYSAVPIEMPVLSERWVLRLDQSLLAKHMKSVLWLKFRCGRFCKKDDLNVFWSPATFLPQISPSVRTVITVHDLNFKEAPSTMTFTHRWAFKMFFKKDVLRADVVITNSKGTSDRLFGFFGRASDAIIYPSINASFRMQTETSIQEVLLQHALSRKYILAVATWEPRKNLELLIHTFLKMKEQGLLAQHKLVLVGGRGWKDNRLAGLLSGTDSVIPLGYVPEDQLAPLYSGAEIFIFPSIYEGFGMPVAEARACGAKVVASDTPELREAGDDNVIYIMPTASGIRQGILDALSQGKLSAKSERDFFSWEEGARVLAKILTGAKGFKCESNNSLLASRKANEKK